MIIYFKLHEIIALLNFKLVYNENKYTYKVTKLTNTYIHTRWKGVHLKTN